MPNRAKRVVPAGVHMQEREDILNPSAIEHLSAGAVSAMSAVGAAVIKMHKQAADKKAEWFWHMFAKCEAKAARLAEQAAEAPDACGDATFIEVYAKNLPKLMADALRKHEQALAKR